MQLIQLLLQMNKMGKFLPLLVTKNKQEVGSFPVTVTKQGELVPSTVDTLSTVGITVI